MMAIFVNGDQGREARCNWIKLGPFVRKD